MIADLDRLNQNTEQDFLRIGGKLAEFIEAVNLISSELAALAELISGEHGLRASQALTTALERSVEMNARYADHNGGLGGMRNEAGQLKRTLTGFQGTVSTFHTLGVLTRIETARFGDAGADFGNLADDVNLLAGSVQTRVANALDAAALLISPIETAMRSISAIEEGQAQDLPSLISGILASLSSFRDIQNKTHDSSVRLGAQYGAISDAFKQLIVSIQFHDITRQQIEHVIEVLRRLCSGSEGDQRGAAAVLTLQSSQLADAGEKFAASADSVARNLNRIAAHVLAMADESRTLSGLSDDEKNSFFIQMERGCTTILASLSHSANAEAATRATGGALAETIGRMRRSIEEIRAIEIQMQRMALNASINAAHLGSSGDSLGVLAGTMQQLAFESRQRSDTIIEALGSMREAATRLSGQGGSAPASERGGQGDYLEGMRTAVAELHSSSERSFAQIAQIVTLGTRLREDLSETRRSFSVGAVFAEAINAARAAFREIGENSRSGFSSDGIDVPEPGLADFARHYTMQAERDVHASVANTAVGAVQAVVTTEPSEFAPEKADDLGDNVEFF